MALPANRHPVDELADIRAERKRLDEREAELRDILLFADADGRAGSEFTARVVTRQQRRLDRTLLAQRFGSEAVEQCCRLLAVTAIYLKPKGGPPSQQAQWRQRWKRRSDPHNDGRNDELANLRAERRA